MKTFFLLPALILLLCPFTSTQAQNIHYYEVVLQHQGIPPGWDWRDTSFVIAADDPALIQQAQQELSLPLESRKHVTGTPVGGHGGFNHTGNYWYHWHFPVNNWALFEFAIEVCDGRPYADVEQDTAYWISTVGAYCPWSSYIAREIDTPVSIENPASPTLLMFSNMPNPANEETTFKWSLKEPAYVALTLQDLSGKLIIRSFPGDSEVGDFEKTVNTAALTPGIWTATLQAGNAVRTMEFVVAH